MEMRLTFDVDDRIHMDYLAYLFERDTRRFYSYRMEKGQTGRMLALFGPDHATRPHQIIM